MKREDFHHSTEMHLSCCISTFFGIDLMEEEILAVHQSPQEAPCWNNVLQWQSNRDFCFYIICIIKGHVWWIIHLWIYDALNLCWDNPDDGGGGLNWTWLSSEEALLQ